MVLETRGRHTWTFSLPIHRENIRSAFSLPEGPSVPAGIYQSAGGQVQYQAPEGNLIRPRVTFDIGQFFDGRQVSLSVGPDWNPSMHLSLGGSYRLDFVEFPDRQQSFSAHVARFRTEVMLSTKTSALSLIQYNSTQNTVTANFRFYYNPREGNDFYIVWNEGLTTDRYSFHPVRPLRNERTILIKYAHTLSFGI